MAEKKLTHGGDWAGFAIEYGREPLDYSMNVNPLGIPQEVQQAIAEASLTADRYPDPLCRALTQKLAGYEQVQPEQIFCGNGAADIIFRLAQVLKPELTDLGPEPAPGSSVGENAAGNFEGKPAGCRPTLLITAPTFSEYETAFAANGWQIRRYLLKEENGFRIEEDFLDEIGPAGDGAKGGGSIDAVFLCEPNNPTGITTDDQLLRKILKKCRETGTRLVIDECFNGFLEEPEAHTMKAMLGDADSPDGDRAGGLIILKAFTKLYGMAGVRLGYCLCRAEITEKLRAAGPPWNVSSLAQEAGIAALDAEGHIRKGLAIVHEERPWLKEQLRKLGFERVYGEANYLLFYAGPGLDERLRERGILIRNCSNYPGLDDGWFRIAVRTHEENEQLVAALREELK